MNLIDRIINQKNKGDSSNYDKVFTDLRSMSHSVPYKFVFDNHEISWTYFRPVDFYNEMILDNDDYIFFYLRNENLAFEAIFFGYSSEHNKPMPEREVSIISIYNFGQIFPGLESFEKRPVRIAVNYSIPRCPLKKMNFYFRTTLDKFKLKSKPIFELTDNYTENKGWKKIVEKNKL